MYKDTSHQWELAVSRNPFVSMNSLQTMIRALPVSWARPVFSAGLRGCILSNVKENKRKLKTTIHLDHGETSKERKYSVTTYTKTGLMQIHTHSRGKGWGGKSGVQATEFKPGTSKHLAFGLKKTYKHTQTYTDNWFRQLLPLSNKKYVFICSQIFSQVYSNLSPFPLWT